MSQRSVVDTNIWVYAVDTGEPAKRSRALEVLAPGPDKDYVVSAQVLGEFLCDGHRQTEAARSAS